MIAKETMVRVRTNNGGEITARLLVAYRPTYDAVINVSGHCVVIIAPRFTDVGEVAR
jgi:hypothetical protein